MSDRSKAVEAVKAQIRSLPADMSKGQRALESLAIYRAARLPVPEEVLRQIDNCYRNFIHGKPAAFFTEKERNIPAPLTLGEAFGVPDLRGGEKSAIKRKRLAMLSPDLVSLFTGQGVGKLPRGRNGFETAAKQLGLTISEVEDWAAEHLPSIRPKGPHP